jgi:hypothetical protein
MPASSPTTSFFLRLVARLSHSHPRGLRGGTQGVRADGLLKTLLKHPTLKVFHLLTDIDKFCFTPLHQACLIPDQYTLRILVECGQVDVNVPKCVKLGDTCAEDLDNTTLDMILEVAHYTRGSKVGMDIALGGINQHTTPPFSKAFGSDIFTAILRSSNSESPGEQREDFGVRPQNCTIGKFIIVLDKELRSGIVVTPTTADIRGVNPRDQEPFPSLLEPFFEHEISRGISLSE